MKKLICEGYIFFTGKISKTYLCSAIQLTKLYDYSKYKYLNSFFDSMDCLLLHSHNCRFLKYFLFSLPNVFWKSLFPFFLCNIVDNLKKFSKYSKISKLICKLIYLLTISFICKAILYKLFIKGNNYYRKIRFYQKFEGLTTKFSI